MNADPNSNRRRREDGRLTPRRPRRDAPATAARFAAPHCDRRLQCACSRRSCSPLRRCRPPAPQGAGTLDQVKARGQLICGANPGLAGFGLPDDQGVYKGLDVDECRAIAAAIFNDPNKVKYLPINAKDRPTILASGQIDVLIRNTTWTLSRETGGMFFTGINYYDGQGFMVRKKLGIELGPQARRRLGLRAAGHDDRTQPRRLLPRPQHEVRAGRASRPTTKRPRPTTPAAATPTRPTPPASTPSD